MQRFRILLWPFGFIYGLIMWVRNKLFDIGILKQSKFDLPVIGIGNLSLGGSGKTPMTLFLADHLKGRYVTAILSRGYGRKSKGYLLADESSSSTTFGDEPFMMSQKLKNVPIAVCEDRVIGVLQLLTDKPLTEVVLLDDVFQHRHIKPGLQILLTEYDNPYCDDLMLPAGNLRELKTGSERANIIIVTKCPKFPTENEIQLWRKRLKISGNQKLFFAQYINGEPEIVFGSNSKSPESVVLITGIAKAAYLIRYIEKNYQIAKHYRFADHHIFLEKEIQQVVTYMRSKKIKTFFTTEKDWVRLEPFKSIFFDLNVSVIPLSVVFNNQMELLEIIESYIKKNTWDE